MVIRQSMLCLLLVLLTAPSIVQAEEELTISAEQWEVTRQGERLVELQPVRQLVKQWSRTEDKMIELQYPGGEEGELWVNELKDWLISLGVASKYQLIVPGSGHDDLIRFKLINGGENYR